MITNAVMVGSMCVLLRRESEGKFKVRDEAPPRIFPGSASDLWSLILNRYDSGLLGAKRHPFSLHDGELPM
jgi:hypothetical protein